MKYDIVSPYYQTMLANGYLSLVNSTAAGSMYQAADSCGSGTIQRISLGDGLDVSRWESFSAANLRFTDLCTNQEVLEISYCLAGQMEVHLPEKGVSYTVAATQILLYYHKNFLASFQLKAENYSGFSIHIHRDYLQGLLASACEATLKMDWQNNMRQLFQSAAMPLEIAPLRLQLMAQRLEMPVLGTMEEYLFFQAKIMEFVSCCLQLGAKVAKDRPLRTAEIAVVEKAQQYLLANLNQPPSVKELARCCSTNSTKLQNDFKRVYHTTIYAYVKEQRLLKALELLRNTELTITDIAGQVGYTNASKFATAFKAFAGMSPREYKNSEKQR